MKHAIPTILLACALFACSDFDDLTRGVCGNGVIEAGEDCDTDDASCVRCAIACETAADCPGDPYACGADGFCHAPSGVFAPPSTPVAFGADDVRVTDIDRDGIGDVLGVSATSIAVRHGDASGLLARTSSLVTPAQSGPHAFGDLDGDGTIDVTVPTPDGIVSYTSRLGTLSPVDIATPIVGDAGEPVNILRLFSVGQFQLGAFIDDGQNHVLLLVLDFLKQNASYIVAPCVNRIGPVSPLQIVMDDVDLYRASAPTALTSNVVVAFRTTTGAVCATSIHGTSAAGYTFLDITGTGTGALAKRPVLVDLDADGDPCPSLVSSDGGAAALRAWDGQLVNGRCTLAAAGVSGAALPAVADAPAGAVAVGRVPIEPPIAGLASDALVLTSGIYGFAPGFNAFGEIYSSSSRQIALITTGDLDRDGDTDVVLATADDDLDVLYRFPLGLQLLRVDTASRVTSVTIGDYDGNGINDIAYTEVGVDREDMLIAYGTTDRPLPPTKVSSFRTVGSIVPLSFADSVDTLSIADDLAVTQPADGDALPTLTILHGSPQRTMLSFFDPRDESLRSSTVLRGGVIGNFADAPAGHPDLVAFAAPRDGATGAMRAFRVAGTDDGLDGAPSLGTPATGLDDCSAGGICVQNAEYLAWPLAPDHDVVLAVDRQLPPHAALLDPWATTGLAPQALPALVERLPQGAVVHALYPFDTDGDGALDLVASFQAPDGLTGSARICRVTDGVPEACEELAAIVGATPGSSVTACVDAAPARVGARSGLVVLCHEIGSDALYHVTREPTGYVATAITRATDLHAVRVGDVTGDQLDDIVAIQGRAGASSLIVFAQCSTRDAATCEQAAASEAP
ncbi:MAG TPA: VCBS repeat-containing protein [Kofleriaceae bacterium]|nr:VCBS repeat-containing protein [Kofleriaceae bacterium]